MFVGWLHDSDTPGFARMMNVILDGHRFVEAVDVGFHQDVHSLWQKFAQTSNRDGDRPRSSADGSYFRLSC